MYLDGKAYLIVGSSSNITKLLETLSGVVNIVNEQAIVNSHVQSSLSEIYSDALKYLDTASDRELL